MRLYSGHTPDFILATTRNQIAERLHDAFFSHYRYHPSPTEVNSWRNSRRAREDVLELGGRDASAADQAVVVELKQWDNWEPADPPISPTAKLEEVRGQRRKLRRSDISERQSATQR